MRRHIRTSLSRIWEIGPGADQSHLIQGSWTQDPAAFAAAGHTIVDSENLEEYADGLERSKDTPKACPLCCREWTFAEDANEETVTCAHCGFRLVLPRRVKT